MKSILLTSIVLFIGGCAGPAYVYDPAAYHPANPAAATAPLPAASTVLTMSATAPAPATAPAAIDHSGHAEHTGHAAPATKQAAALYVCPMHPEVTSNDPKARCHICGMFLKPPKEAAR